MTDLQALPKKPHWLPRGAGVGGTSDLTGGPAKAGCTGTAGTQWRSRTERPACSLTGPAY